MKARAAGKVPAVIVGGGINGLGVLRSLARANVPAVVLDPDATQPGMRSRYGRKVTYSDNTPDAVVGALEALVADSNGERPVLILTQEQTVTRVSAHRERLQPLYRFTLPGHNVLAALTHKDGFRAAAEAAGAAIPRTLRITVTGEIADIGTLQPPLIVKPAIRDTGYASAFRKAYRIDSVDEAQDLVGRILPTLPDVVVQEWIEGADSDIYFCLQYITSSGDVAASFVGRKIRSWPPRVGGTASCAPTPDRAEADVLIRRSYEFFEYAGIRGFAGMEYKRDVRSGEFFMVEPTIGRTDYQEEVAALNGVNIPLAAYHAELGLPSVRKGARTATRVWRDRLSDRCSAAETGDAAPWRPEQALTVDALWRFSDPMPAIAPFAERVSRRVRRLHPGHNSLALRK